MLKKVYFVFAIVFFLGSIAFAQEKQEKNLTEKEKIAQRIAKLLERADEKRVQEWMAAVGILPGVYAVSESSLDSIGTVFHCGIMDCSFYFKRGNMATMYDWNGKCDKRGTWKEIYLEILSLSEKYYTYPDPPVQKVASKK
ncbi:MAG: hypothetical protein HYW78_01335 [Parcubacteria group bacterium]|nr:hypothetical protein [Parcubacteria group bacterium]